MDFVTLTKYGISNKCKTVHQAYVHWVRNTTLEDMVLQCLGLHQEMRELGYLQVDQNGNYSFIDKDEILPGWVEEVVPEEVVPDTEPTVVVEEVTLEIPAEFSTEIILEDTSQDSALKEAVSE